MRQLKVIFLILIILQGCKNSPHFISGNQDCPVIVSLLPSVTEDLILLDALDCVSGFTAFCSPADSLPGRIVGNVTEVNVENIILIKPDIVFASSLTPSSDLKVLKNSGIQLYMVPKQTSFDDICREFVTIGKYAGKERLAVEMVERYKQKIDSIKNVIPAMDKKPKIFIQLGANPLFAVIPETFMDEYITIAGGENIFKDLKHGVVTRESVISRNPDVIFVTTMGMVGEKEIEVWKNYKTINAVKNNRIYLIESDISCVPTPANFVASVQYIVDKLYFDAPENK